MGLPHSAGLDISYEWMALLRLVRDTSRDTGRAAIALLWKGGPGRGKLCLTLTQGQGRKLFA
jgi:hypothetical protein